MSLLMVLGVALVVGVAVVLIVLVRQDQQRRPIKIVVLHQARHRALLCVGLAVAMLVAGAAFDAAAPQLAGMPIALAPALAAAGALLGYAALPPRAAAPDGPVTASLSQRTAWSYGSRRAFAVPGTIAIAMLCFLTWGALVADPDDRGRMRTIGFTDGPVGSSAGPFPGSYYGAPLALATVLLAASTYLALRRISGTPTMPDLKDAAVDRSWRVASTRLVTAVANAALLGSFGGAALFAGLATHSAASTLVSSGGQAPGIVLAGRSLAVVGAALVVAGVVSAFLAVAQALTLTSTRPADTPTSSVTPAR